MIYSDITKLKVKHFEISKEKLQRKQKRVSFRLENKIVEKWYWEIEKKE